MVTLVFELSLRLRPAPLRCPHGDCGSRSIIKYGKGKRKNIPDVQRYLCKARGRTLCDRAGTPYYRKHYPALVMLTCLDLFHALNTPMRRRARLVPHVPRKPSHRTVTGVAEGPRPLLPPPQESQAELGQGVAGGRAPASGSEESGSTSTWSWTPIRGWC
ncbi:MAG: hypothetical protein Q6352_016435 [Candidatus Freyrarchaeum guaymaensis]